MNQVVIGQGANGKPVSITRAMRESTHMHIIGGSGKGKSKFLEWMIRRNIREGHGLCLLDWHGTLYKDVLRYCSHLEVGLDRDFRSLILLNPSRPDYVTGFNPFMNQGADIATQVSRRISATIRPWGITDTNVMPTFERVCRLLYTFAVEQRETLPNTANLLQFDRPELREYAASVVTDSYVRQQWQQLAQMKNYRDWKEFVLSTENRLSRFLASKTIKRFMGLTDNNIDLIDAMDQGKIILVNLGSSGFLDRESARVFASLLLNEFFESAMLRAERAPAGLKPKTFSLYLDEFQEYITDDVAAMLDQVRKGGLHMVLAHQHLGHMAENERLLQSVLTNARLRAVFGGLAYTDACVLANEMFLPDLNTRQIKKAYYHTIHLYDEQTRKVTSRSFGEGQSSSHNWSEGSGTSSGSGSGVAVMTGRNYSTGRSTPERSVMGAADSEGWFSESESYSEGRSSVAFASDSYSEFSSVGGSEGVSTFHSSGESEVPVWVPIPVKELTTEAEWSREEKVSKVAEMLKHQQERHCFIKLDTELTQPLRVPFVQDYSQSEQTLLDYERAVYDAQDAIAGSEVDKLLADSENRFLARISLPRQSTTDLDVADDQTPVIPASKKTVIPLKKSARAQLFSSLNAKELLDQDH
jgi:hypothetical protein